MSKCKTCVNFVWQAVVSKHLPDGVIFMGTPLEQPVNKNGLTYPQAGCIHSSWKWRVRGRIRKPSNMPCEYRRAVEK